MPSQIMTEYLRLESELDSSPDTSEGEIDRLMAKMDLLWIQLTDDEMAELDARGVI